MHNQSAPSARAMLAVACGMFFATGTLLASFGPALPDLARATGSELAAMGSVFTAISVGAVLSQFLAPPATQRIGRKYLLLVGMSLLALGMAGVPVATSLAALLACIVVGGIGFGIVLVISNVLVAQLFAQRSAAALNGLNVFYGLGAIIGPAVAALAARWLGSTLVVFWMGATLLLLLLPLAMRWIQTPPEPPAQQAHAARGALFRSPVIWLLGILLFIYTGTEIGVGGWSASYMEQSAGFDPTTAALVTSAFWLALTIGRALGAVLGTRFTATTLLLGCLVGITGGAALLVASSGNSAVSIAAFGLLGVAFGPVFPLVMALTTGLFRDAGGTAASIVVGLGNSGALVLPALQGLLLGLYGPQASVVQTLLAALLMLALFWWLRWQLNPRQHIPPVDPALKLKREA